MVLKVYAVYDSKLEAYMQPFFMQSKGVALRALTETLTQRDHMFSKHPEDFTLFELGEYDDSNGKMLPHLTPIALCKANELIKPEAPVSQIQLQKAQ